eukprot:TRINITY_DN119_c2_g1_i3.p1 TRINITY_DN119_c2_g1~~TRINITY_DN119_c2_g1_i3.p1  ORF type:complete len:436 (+),score=84.29 TRINITY_DN119_c2_g1_i3:78-1310(+)
MAGIGALVDAMDRQAEEAEAAALAADAAAEAAIEAQLPVMHPHEGQQFWYIGIHVKYRRIDDAAMQEAVAAKARLRMAGLCSVCLEEQQVVGAEYLHGTASYCASEAYRDATAVHDSTHVACEGCLAKYFTAIVAEGYNGVCPRMKCPFCPLVVPEMRWSALVEPETSRLVRQRAAILLTLQCSSCHTRCSLMEFAHYSAGSADFEKALPGALAADLSLFEAGAISATVFLERIAAAVDGDIAQPCAVTAEHDPELNYVVPETTTRVWALMREVFKCIQDWERRAVLHSRFLSLHPVVQTPCCMAVHCYRCRVGHVHHGQTCAEYQAATYPSEELVATCPNCGIYIVKNDGCSSVSCVCGHGFCFESRLQELGLLHTEVRGTIISTLNCTLECTELHSTRKCHRRSCCWQ